MLQLMKFLKDQNGTTAIEYGLIVALVGLALVGIANSQYGFGLKTGFENLGEQFAANTSY